MGASNVRRVMAAMAVSAVSVAAQDVVEVPAVDRSLAADFEDVYRVGSFDGAEWETFGRIQSVGFDGAGNLYVFDRQSSRIVVVDPEGRFVRAFGRPGEGPGELRLPAGMVVMRDGRVVVADMGHRAYTLFSADGTFERMIPMGGGGMIRLGELSLDPTREAVISGGGGTVVSFSTGGDRDAPTTRPVDRIDLSGPEAVTETFVDAWLPPRGEPTTLEGGGMSFRMTTAGPRTFEPGLHVGVLPTGGVAYVDSTTYVIKVTGRDGVVQRVVRRPIRPRRVTERMMEAERQRQLDELEEGDAPQMRMVISGGGGAAPRQIDPEQVREMQRNRIEGMEFYPELPVVMDLATTWSGKVWVQRRGEAPTERGPIDVLTYAGNYAGTFPTGEAEIPDAFGPDGLAAWIDTGEFDVPIVVVRRLPPVVR